MTTPTGKSPLALPAGYADWLAQLKGQIAQTRQRAALAVNARMAHLVSSLLTNSLTKPARRSALATCKSSCVQNFVVFVHD